MREGIPSSSPSRNPCIVWTGAILVIIGLSVLLAAGEWFAAFDACVANPACNAGVSPTTLESYLSLIVAGVGFAVIGVTVALDRGWTEPRRAMILWL